MMMLLLVMTTMMVVTLNRLMLMPLLLVLLRMQLCQHSCRSPINHISVISSIGLAPTYT